jgi:hypothetical protein
MRRLLVKWIGVTLFVWRYSPGINRDDPNWRHVWDIVNDNKQVLIQYWDAHYDEIVKRFDWRYDGLF